jgi:hypothetical protein
VPTWTVVVVVVVVAAAVVVVVAAAAAVVVVAAAAVVVPSAVLLTLRERASSRSSCLACRWHPVGPSGLVGHTIRYVNVYVHVYEQVTEASEFTPRQAVHSAPHHHRRLRRRHHRHHHAPASDASLSGQERRECHRKSSRHSSRRRGGGRGRGAFDEHLTRPESSSSLSPREHHWDSVGTRGDDCDFHLVRERLAGLEVVALAQHAKQQLDFHDRQRPACV